MKYKAIFVSLLAALSMSCSDGQSKNATPQIDDSEIKVEYMPTKGALTVYTVIDTKTGKEYIVFQSTYALSALER